MKLQILDIAYEYDRAGFPVIVIYGNTAEGQSITKRVTGFLPYFYVDHIDLAQAEKYLSTLGHKIGIEMRFSDVWRFRPLGYQSKPTTMLKVEIKNPRDSKLLNEFCTMDGFTTYESDTIFRDRFAIDHEISGAGWIITPEQATISNNDVIAVDEKQNSPLRMMSIDIETLPKEDGSFPTADVNPIVLISMEFNPKWRGQDNVVMVAKELGCPRQDVICSDNETDMLKKLDFIINEFNPDLIAGHNVVGFDIPYITDRANILKVKLRMSRDGKPAFCTSFMGKNKVSLTGRIVLDTLSAIKALDKYRLKSYSLKNVAKEILGSEKLDVKPGEMRSLWEGPGIIQFISYSRRDASLVMRLISHLKLMDKYFALSKASGAFLQVIVNGGQAGMIEARLSRAFFKEHRAMGTKQALEDDDMSNVIKGAIVLDPKIGLTENVVILDYRSLYPSIMIAHNLCYSTEIRDEQPPGDIITTPCDGKFVSQSTYIGIVPRILKTLLAERLAVKDAMKTASNPMEKDTLDAQQYALKILLNSIYGYSGYTRARLFSPIITNSVTAYGRENLLRTKDIVEDNAKFELDGKKYELSVVAGDTDSIFISISGCKVDFEIAKTIGKQIAILATDDLPKPMELVFEAFAKRLLIIAKKRYAMYLFESPDKGAIKAKGIETIRRDWCNLTASTLTRCLELILIEGNTNLALNHARKALNAVKSPSKEILKDLVLTRTLTMNPETYKQVQPHSELVKKLEKRGIYKYVIGDRIPFIIVKSEHNKKLMTQKAEDPEYVLEHNLKIDTEYYIQKQLLPPLTRIFACFGINTLDLMLQSKQQTLFLP